MFILFFYRIATQSSSQSWPNKIRDYEFIPLNMFAVASLGNIAACRSSRPDWVTVIVELLGNWTVVPYNLVFT